MVSLERLDLFDKDLSGVLPSEWGGLASLERLDLDGNAFSGCIPYDLAGGVGLGLSSIPLPVCIPPPAELDGLE